MAVESNTRLPSPSRDPQVSPEFAETLRVLGASPQLMRKLHPTSPATVSAGEFQTRATERASVVLALPELARLWNIDESEVRRRLEVLADQRYGEQIRELAAHLDEQRAYSLHLQAENSRLRVAIEDLLRQVRARGSGES